MHITENRIRENQSSVLEIPSLLSEFTDTAKRELKFDIEASENYNRQWWTEKMLSV